MAFGSPLPATRVSVLAIFEVCSKPILAPFAIRKFQLLSERISVMIHFITLSFSLCPSFHEISFQDNAIAMHNAKAMPLQNYEKLKSSVSLKALIAL